MVAPRGSAGSPASLPVGPWGPWGPEGGRGAVGSAGIGFSRKSPRSAGLGGRSEGGRRMPGTQIIGRSGAMFEQQTLLMLDRAWGTAGNAGGRPSPELRKLFQVPSLLGHEYTVTSLDLDLPLTVSPSMVSPTRRIIEAKLGPVLEDE